MIYAQKFKEAIIQKHLVPGGPTLAILAKDNNIPVGTIYGWKNSMVRRGIVENSKKSKWSPEKKLKVIAETLSLTGNELGEYLRKNGLHSSDLDEWKNDFYKSQASAGRPKIDPEVSELRKSKKELEKNLNRKDKALAEMSARVILLKKSHQIFGDNEDEE